MATISSTTRVYILFNKIKCVGSLPDRKVARSVWLVKGKCVISEGEVGGFEDNIVIAKRNYMTDMVHCMNLVYENIFICSRD